MEINDFPYNSWEPVYSNSELNTLPWDYPDVRTEFINAVDHINNKKGMVLDIGCGTGASSRYLSSIGFDVTAIDISKTAITLAKKKMTNSKGRLIFSVNNILNIEKTNLPQRYNLIVDWLCLHHIQENDIDNYFNIINTMLIANGNYLVAVFIADKSFKRASYFSDGEVIYWSKEKLLRYFKKGRIIYQSTFYAGSIQHNYLAGVFLLTKEAGNE